MVWRYRNNKLREVFSCTPAGMCYASHGNKHPLVLTKRVVSGEHEKETRVLGYRPARLRGRAVGMWYKDGKTTAGAGGFASTASQRTSSTRE